MLGVRSGLHFRDHAMEEIMRRDWKVLREARKSILVPGFAIER